MEAAGQGQMEADAKDRLGPQMLLMVSLISHAAGSGCRPGTDGD